MPEKVIEFYTRMRLAGVEENRFTFIFVLKAYASRRCSFEGRLLHGKVLKMGFDCDVYVNNAMIHFYAKCEDVGSARKLFSEMPVNSLVNWNTLVSACLNCGDIENGRKLFDEMPERNTESWNVVISGYCKLGHFDTARSLFDTMGESERDLVSWATMIGGYVQSRQPHEALKLFKAMQFSGFKPDNVTITCALSACAQIGALDMGKWIHSYVNKNKLRKDVHLDTALVDMYAKCGSIDIAMKFFSEIPNKNLCTWNAMLSGLAIHGHGMKALELFRQMESIYGILPNDVTFVAVLAACSHIGATSKGKRLFERMQKEYNIVPKIEHYGCMVDLLGRGGLINEAKELIRNMPMEPNAVIWSSLLNACRIYEYMDTDEDMTGIFSNLVTGDGGTNVLFSNICAARSDWDAMESARKISRGPGAKKIPGCSAIEVDCVIDEFFVEDRSHSQWMQIKEIVERLQNQSEVEGYVPNPSFITS